MYTKIISKMQQRGTHASYIIKSKDQHAEYSEPKTKIKKPAPGS